MASKEHPCLFGSCGDKLPVLTWMERSANSFPSREQSVAQCLIRIQSFHLSLSYPFCCQLILHHASHPSTPFFLLWISQFKQNWGNISSLSAELLPSLVSLAGLSHVHPLSSRSIRSLNRSWPCVWSMPRAGVLHLCPEAHDLSPAALRQIP